MLLHINFGIKRVDEILRSCRAWYRFGTGLVEVGKNVPVLELGEVMDLQPVKKLIRDLRKVRRNVVVIVMVKMANVVAKEAAKAIDATRILPMSFVM